MSDGQAAPLRRIPGSTWFFPVATAYAIVVVPASVAAMLGATAWLPGLASPAGHAHELLFGFALAVVAGNQLGPREPRTLVALLATWALARATFVAAPASAASIAANVLFPALLAWHVAPRLLASAKKWRNRALPATLVALCASAVAATLTVALQRPTLPSRAALGVAVALFALLLLFMGGRLIAPTIAGQLYRQGGNLEARVQPRIEAALIVVMAIAIAGLVVDALVPHPGAAARILAGAALAVAGVLAAIRLLRWRVWRVERRPDLWCLTAGYAWLAAGLVLFGVAHAMADAARFETLAIHVITIGSLGTLTLNVMALTRLLMLRRAPADTPHAVQATILLAAATLLRIVAGVEGNAPWALYAASACWSGAYLLLFALLVSLARARPARRVAPPA